MKNASPVAAAPSRFVSGVTPGWDRLTVVDAATGVPLDHVVEVDAEKDLVRRLEVDGDSLVVRNGNFVVIEEKRAVRLEYVASIPAPADETPAAEAGA